MLNPDLLFPEALGVEWGSGLTQCIRRLGASLEKVRHGGVELSISAGGEDYAVFLAFWDTEQHRYPDAGAPTLQAVEVILYAAAEFSPFDFVEGEGEALPDTQELGAIHDPGRFQEGIRQ